MTDPSPRLAALAAAAWRIRRLAVRMGEVQGQGYIGQALGWADVLAVAYRHALKLKPDEPRWEGRDRFLLSHGHYAIAHYAALIEAGVLAEDELETYGSDDSRLPMSGMASYTPGMEISGGSLGQGLGHRRRHGAGPEAEEATRPSSTTAMSDGELDEGSTWEAAMSAAHHRKLDNLICLVDINNQQADGPSGEGARLRAARRQVGRVRLARAARRRATTCPRCSPHSTRPARWRKPSRASSSVRHADGQGRALPRAAREEPLHPRRPAGMADQALAILDAGTARGSTVNSMRTDHRRTQEPPRRPTTSAMIASIASEGPAHVKAAPFGKALVDYAAKAGPSIVGLTADLAKYTDLHLFAQAYPDRFFQMGMAEQLLMGAAGGMAKEGLVPFATTYAVFGTRRAYDFIHQVIAEEDLNVKICCALPGLTTGYGPEPCRRPKTSR